MSFGRRKTNKITAEETQEIIQPRCVINRVKDSIALINKYQSLVNSIERPRQGKQSYCCPFSHAAVFQ